jgi:hypothetical protein
MVVKATTSLARKILKEKRKLAKVQAQILVNDTPARRATENRSKDRLAKLQEQTKAAKKAKEKAKEKPKTVQERKETAAKVSTEARKERKTAAQKRRAAYRQGMKDKTPEDRKEIIKLRAEQKREEIQDKLDDLKQDRAFSLTEEGETLMNSSNPRDQDKLLNHIRKHKGRSKYIYVRLDAPLRAKGTRLTEKEIQGSGMSTVEEIEQRMGRTGPLLTRSQATREIRGKDQTLDPSDLQNFRELRRGGLTRKRYQSSKKYGPKYHVYVGGGKVEDIMQFKKKRGR